MINFIIILLNYNNWIDTFECVESLLNVGINKENILIVDNCSTNDSINKLKNRLEKITIISTKYNLGFSGGNNFGYEYSKRFNPEYVIFLNNDTILEKNSIEILIKEMDNDDSIIAGTGLISYYPDKDKVWYGGGRLINPRGLAVHDHYNKSKIEIKQKLNKHSVDFISGCFLCIKAEEFEEVGKWDESFFLYLEDIELSARLKKNHHKMLFVPEAEIFHKCNGENKLNLNMLYYSVRNRLLLIDKQFSIIAKIYFMTVIKIKLIIWFYMNKNYYKYANKGLLDYKKKYFGKLLANWND